MSAPLRLLGIYRSMETGYTRVGEYRVEDQGGHARLTVLVEEARSDLERIDAKGIAPFSLRRIVRPAEGETFIEALREYFGNSSIWRVKDETEN